MHGYCSQLSTTKEGSEPSTHHRSWKPHRLSRWANNLHCWPHHFQNSLEQHPKHSKHQVHVCRQQTILPVHTNGSSRVYEDESRPISRRIHAKNTTCMTKCTKDSFVTTNVWIATSGHPLQQITTQAIGNRWLLRITAHTRTMEACMPSSAVHVCCGWFWCQIRWKGEHRTSYASSAQALQVEEDWTGG